MPWIAECECGATTYLKFRERVPNQMVRWTFEAECPACGTTATYDYKAIKAEVA